MRVGTILTAGRFYFNSSIIPGQEHIGFRSVLVSRLYLALAISDHWASGESARDSRNCLSRAGGCGVVWLLRPQSEKAELSGLEVVFLLLIFQILW